MSPTLDFRSSAEGAIPEFANATATVMGKKGLDPVEVATQLKDAADAGKVSPMNMIAATKRIAPGGRSPDEIDPKLLEGAEPFKPKDDMFGAPVVVK